MFKFLQFKCDETAEILSSKYHKTHKQVQRLSNIPFSGNQFFVHFLEKFD